MRDNYYGYHYITTFRTFNDKTFRRVKNEFRIHFLNVQYGLYMDIIPVEVWQNIINKCDYLTQNRFKIICCYFYKKINAKNKFINCCVHKKDALPAFCNMKGNFDIFDEMNIIDNIQEYLGSINILWKSYPLKFHSKDNFEVFFIHKLSDKEYFLMRKLNIWDLSYIQLHFTIVCKEDLQYNYA